MKNPPKRAPRPNLTWLTNSNTDTVIEDALYHPGQRIGEPQAMEHVTVEELKEKGYVGIYRVEEESAS